MDMSVTTGRTKRNMFSAPQTFRRLVTVEEKALPPLNRRKLSTWFAIGWTALMLSSSLTIVTLLTGNRLYFYIGITSATLVCIILIAHSYRKSPCSPA